jgi:hypothetical protein
VEVVDDEPLEGYDRIYAYDPFGNRLELLATSLVVARRGPPHLRPTARGARRHDGHRYGHLYDAARERLRDLRRDVRAREERNGARGLA